MDLKKYLIIGLGNPGPEYEWTPHNLGFMVVDRLAQRIEEAPEPPMFERRIVDYLKRLSRKARYETWRSKSSFALSNIWLAGHPVILAKPQTYMNSSGIGVLGLLSRYSCRPKDLIVIADDVSLPWGVIRIREKGSAGGHKGLKSVIELLRTDEFLRVRVGIGPRHQVRDLSEYVLKQTRTKVDKELALLSVELAADAVELIVSKGPSRAMERFNKKPAAEHWN